MGWFHILLLTELYREVQLALITHNGPHVSTGKMSRLLSFVLLHIGPCFCSASQRLPTIYSNTEKRLTAAELCKVQSNNKDRCTCTWLHCGCLDYISWLAWLKQLRINDSDEPHRLRQRPGHQRRYCTLDDLLALSCSLLCLALSFSCSCSLSLSPSRCHTFVSQLFSLSLAWVQSLLQGLLYRVGLAWRRWLLWAESEPGVLKVARRTWMASLLF